MLLIILVLPLNLFSAEFVASVSKNPLTQGERFQITYTINAEGSNFQGPNFKGFTFLGGPSVGHSISMVNNKISRTVTYSYILMAGEPGKYNISPATIVIEGKTIKSNPLEINVVKSNTTNQQQSQKPEQQQAEEVIKDNLFIILSVSKSEVYEGEELIVTYKLLKNPNLNLVNLNSPKMPVFNGFWSQELQGTKEAKWESEIYNGVKYQSLTIKKLILIPQRSGNLSIDPLELNCVVQLRVQSKRDRRSIFDDFFDDPFSQNVKNFEYVAKSRSSSIRVKALPQNPPKGFAGAVGKFSLKAWFDKTKTKTNEPISLKVQIGGGGNLKLVQPLNLKFPTDFDAYDPKSYDNLILSNSGFSGNTTFEYILMPRHKGEYEIAPVEFTYFDLASKNYVTLKSEQFKIIVEQGTASENQIVSGVNREELKYLGRDIVYIKSINGELTKSSQSSIYGSFWHFILSALPLALFALFVILRKKQIQESRNIALSRNRKANKTAMKRLALARSYLKQSHSEKFFEEISRALWGYLSHKLNIPVSELNQENALAIMIEYGIDNAIALEILALISECEFARFSPSMSNVDLDSIYDKAQNYITTIENSIRRTKKSTINNSFQ